MTKRYGNLHLRGLLSVRCEGHKHDQVSLLLPMSVSYIHNLPDILVLTRTDLLTP